MKMPDGAPTVSIVIGAYNAQRYLAQTLDTLLAQTLRDFELIVVDDGSEDATPRILEEYKKKDPRVRPLRIAHGGIVDAANAGVEAARSELIARADSDDLYLPQRLEKQVEYLATHPQVVAVGSRMMVIEPYGSPVRISDHKLTHEEIEADLLKGVGWAMPQPVAMLRKSVAVKVGGYRNKYPWSEDLDLFLRMAEVGRLANLPDVLVKYRHHPGSTNWSKNKIQLANKPHMLREAYERRGKQPPEGMIFSTPWVEPLGEKYTHWVWCALKDKNVTGARRHAVSALKASPLRPSAWRAA
ncbi:MAG: glycosyl transferase family 2, partial [Phycisphaerales bacterium]|nr:glycosyl transferase family 2 [Phycisphaerales bacterium]